MKIRLPTGIEASREFLYGEGRRKGGAAERGRGVIPAGIMPRRRAAPCRPFWGRNAEGTGKSADELLAHCLQDTLFPTGDLHLCHTETAGDLGLGFAAVVAQKDEAPIPFLQRG